MKLQLGQIIIWDGYQHIVTAVSETHARVATRSAKNALTKAVIERDQNEFFGQLQGKPVSPESQWADNLLAMTASLGDEAVEFTKPIEEGESEISLEPKRQRLEIGNAVLFLGHKRVAVHAEKSFVKLLRIDGEVLVESNPLECVKLQPTTTVNLETFLSVNSGARTEITKQITAQEKETVVARKKTTPESKQTPRGGLYADRVAQEASVKPHDESAAVKLTPEEKKASKPKKAQRERADMSTRVAFVDEQIAAGKSLEEISPIITEKYFYTPKGYADRLVASRIERSKKKAAK